MVYLLLSGVAAVGGVLYAVKLILEASHEGRAVLRQAKGAVRRAQWRSKRAKYGPSLLADAREAGAALLVQIAAYEGDFTRERKYDLIARMASLFHISDEDAKTLYQAVTPIVRTVHDLGNNLKPVTDKITETCTPEERQEMVVAMRDVAGKTPLDIQADLIARTEKALVS